MSEDGLSEPCDDHSMELFVESLTGTSFEMRVYSTDTVLDIKNKIFRVEGIPVPQQNLLFQMKELSDHSRLADVGIVNGCTLRLVTAMRGGPISTRRWTSDHMVWKDLKDLIEHTREELGDKLGTKVSVLVFKEGDVMKWLRVVENEDGSYSPYTEQRAIAPPCTSGGNDVSGCVSGRGGGGGSIGSRSGNKNYQQHKSPDTDIATLSSNTIDFQDLMQFKQHAAALSYYHQQHQHHHYGHTHHAIGPSTVISGISDQLHQQHQYQKQQVYRRLEDDVRMKGRVKLLKARMLRAKRTKSKGVPIQLTNNNGSALKCDAALAEEIAFGGRNNNLVMTAALNDTLVDGNSDTFKNDLPAETLLRVLQNGETPVPINDRYTLAPKYHRRTHNHNSHLLQLDTTQLSHDNLTLLKPIPTGHGPVKQDGGSSAICPVGTSNTTATRNAGGGETANSNDPNLLLMGCSANTATAMAIIRSNATNTNCIGNGDNSINTGSSSGTANDLEVALKEKHRSSQLRLMRAAPNTNSDSDAMRKRTKTTTIGRRLTNSIDPISNSLNITTVTTTAASPLAQSVLLSNASSNSNYSCTNLHVFEPQCDVITPGIRHDITQKRRSGKVTGAAVESTATSTTSAARDCTRERLSLPETKCRAKIGRLLNTTATPGSGETSDSDDGLWSQTAASSANKIRHYRSTALPLVLPDTTTIDTGKCTNNISASLLDDELQILPDIWEHHGVSSTTTPPSYNSIIQGTGFMCTRTTSTANSNPVDTLATPTVIAMDSGDADDSGIAAACLRDYIDMDNEFDQMFSEFRSAVPIPSAIPPQYAPKDCQLYLGSPVVPRPAPAPNETAVLGKSTTLTASSATHRLSSMSTLPYHVHGLCTSPSAGTSSRRSPLYHRRTTSTTVTTAFTGTTTVSPSTASDDRTAIAAAARSILEKVQRTTGTDIGGVAAIVADKAVRQRRRRYSTDDCEFTLERLQNDYVSDQFDYSDFDSCAADVDDMIGCYGQEAVLNARWMEAASAAASSTRTSGASPTQLPPTARQRNSLRLRATAAHRDSPTDHHLHHHLCLAEQIQRLGLNTDDYGTEGVATSFSNAIGTRMGVMGSGRAVIDNTSNTINIGEFSHSNFVSNGIAPCDNSIVGSTTKLPTLVEHRKQQQRTANSMGATGPRIRCAHCNRKLNITNIYDCRCGRIFCAQHRYSEVHDCAHDYKTEGRRLLAQQNPLVTAPKLAKF